MKSAKRHKDRAAGIGCILCALLGMPGTPAQLHHPREGQGAAQRANDWLVIPLCDEHHTGKTGIHGMGRSAFESRYRLTEMDLLAETYSAVYGGLR